jgi:hypothetical protein
VKPKSDDAPAAEPSIGRNSMIAIDRDKLRDIVQRIEAVEAERAEF